MHNDRSHVQAFPVQIADNQWHRVAVTFTHHFVNVYVDCEQVFERQVDSVDLRFIEENDIRLWVAQKNERLGLLQVCAFYFSLLCPLPLVLCKTYIEIESHTYALSSKPKPILAELNDTFVAVT